MFNIGFIVIVLRDSVLRRRVEDECVGVKDVGVRHYTIGCG